MKLDWRLILIPMTVLGLAMFNACGEDETNGDPPIEGDGRWARPVGSATVWITVDDTANQTYTDGQLIWKGSFAYDASTNIIVQDGAWSGPFVPLYDDGPWTEGGHEASGQVAGDGIFSAEVFFQADPDFETTIEYGMENDAGWIWSGPNGTVVIPAGSSDTHEADGMAIAAHGDIDFMITLDINSLHADFAAYATDTPTVSIKGSFNGWALVELENDGWGFYSMQWSDNLGQNDGLAKLGDQVEFVFVFGESQEYKADGDACTEGVTAYSDYVDRGDLTAEAVILVDGFSGKNTAIIIGGE